MDKILTGIVNIPEKPDGFKETLISLIVQSKTGKPVQEEECRAIFSLCLQWIGQSKKDYLIKIGTEIFSKWIADNYSVFEDYFTPILLNQLLTDSIYVNKAELITHISHVLQILKTKLEYDKLKLLYLEIQANITHFIRDSDHSIYTVCAVVDILTEFPECVPRDKNALEFCTIIIHCIADFAMPTASINIAAFIHDVEKIIKLVQNLWHQLSNEDIHSCLKIFYFIISNPDRECEPCPALNQVLQLFPTQFIPYATQVILSGEASTDANITSALFSLCDWLIKWPRAPNTHQWLMALLKGLANVKKYVILIEVTMETVEKLFNGLIVPVVRGGVISVVFHMLLAFQHSEVVFHKIVGKIPTTVRQLQHENSKSSLQCLELLVEVSYTLIYHHAGFPEMYEPVIVVLQDYPKPSLEQMNELLSCVWLSSPTAGIQDGLGQTSRSETGKVGLVNLGNTCYMNSVVQALYMTLEFRYNVLEAVPSSLQPLLMGLQHVFTFLYYTQRPVYSPEKFLQVSRPPWFEIGHQQDCSEFLRYLLDTLHEEDRYGKKQVEYGERIVIETPQENQGSKKNEDYIVEEETGEITMACMVRDVEDLGEDPAGRMIVREVFDEEEDVENDEDLENLETEGSSLKRWVTEEDITDIKVMEACGFSRPVGKEDEKLENPSPWLQDSHSNSTDSGIQSVGESLDEGYRTVGEENMDECYKILGEESVHDGYKPVGDENMDEGYKPCGDEVGDNHRPLGEKMTETQKLVWEEKLVNADGNAWENNKEEESEKNMICEAATVEETECVSLLHRTFGGKMVTSYRCLTCHTESIHKDCFTDIHLAFPASLKQNARGGYHTRQAAKNTKGESEEDMLEELSLEDLISYYICPERLEGDNQYFCDKCKSLQDAERSTKIIESPQHLMLTLMRFYYDQERKKRCKIFTDVRYPLVLKLPINCSAKTKWKKNETQNEVDEMVSDGSKFDDGDIKSHDLFSLYAIIVHCGYSSDGGHYYTYACHPVTSLKESIHSAQGDNAMESSGSTLDCDNRHNEWYIFNDSRVSYTNYESFLNLTQRFPRDTAYVLFYRKVESERVVTSNEHRTVHLRRDLREAVEMDNLKFMKEMESEAKKNQQLHSEYSNKNHPWKDDDGNPPSSCGGSSGGGLGGINTSGTHFIF